MQAEYLIIESRTKPKIKVCIEVVNYPEILMLKVDRNDNIPEGDYAFNMDDQLSMEMISDLLVLHLDKSPEMCKVLLDLFR